LDKKEKKVWCVAIVEGQGSGGKKKAAVRKKKRVPNEEDADVNHPPAPVSKPIKPVIGKEGKTKRANREAMRKRRTEGKRIKRLFGNSRPLKLHGEASGGRRKSTLLKGKTNSGSAGIEHREGNPLTQT